MPQINITNVEQITYANVSIDVSKMPDGKLALIIFHPAITPTSQPTRMITIPMSREYAKELANKLAAPGIATYSSADLHINGAALA
jgi:hypothetical protein